MNATEHRYEGIQAVNNQVVTVEYVEGQPVNRWHMTNTLEVSELILNVLLPLGRTDRWRAAVEQWAGAVRSEPFEWAFFQYGIYTAYAAK